MMTEADLALLILQFQQNQREEITTIDFFGFPCAEVTRLLAEGWHLVSVYEKPHYPYILVAVFSRVIQ